MDKIAVIYWSGTGNTEAMAQAIANGVKDGGQEVELLEVSQANPKEIGNYAGVLLGCPSMGSEVLEEGDFQPFYDEVEGALAGKAVGLFGSYGWGDGEWMRNWVEQAEGAGLKVFEQGLIINETPDDDGLEECTAFGKRFAQQV